MRPAILGDLMVPGVLGALGIDMMVVPQWTRLSRVRIVKFADRGPVGDQVAARDAARHRPEADDAGRPGSAAWNHARGTRR